MIGGWYVLQPTTRIVRGLHRDVADCEIGSLDAPEQIPSGRYAVVILPNRQGEPVTHVCVGTVPREP